MIKVKRVYDASGPSDGRRFLVERLWPRGVKKEALKLFQNPIPDQGSLLEKESWNGMSSVPSAIY